MKNLKNKLFIIFSLLCALALTSCMDLYDNYEVRTITFVGNGGKTDGGLTSYTQTCQHGEVKPLRKCEFKNEGKFFLGWAEADYATKAEYKDGENYTFNSDKTFYAVWVAGEFTVTFDGNGGKTSGDETTYTQKFTYGIAQKLISNKFVYEGKGFAGWALTKDATTAEYPDENTLSIDRDITLYAVWKNIYTITFDPNGHGHTVDGSMANQKFTEGVEQAIEANQYICSGFDFSGWATSPVNVDEEHVYDNLQKITLNSDIILYAVWVTGNRNLYVSSAEGSSDNNPGTQEKPFKHLQAAITRINAVESYDDSKPWKVFIVGTIEGNTEISAFKTNTLTIIKSGTEDAILKCADSTKPVLSITEKCSITMEEIGIKNGSFANGSALYIKHNNANITLKSSSVTGNTATGSNVYIEAGKLTLDNSQISGNTGTGIKIANDGTLDMTGTSSISNNTGATNGGGVYINGGTFTMNGGSIKGNTVTANGGGVYIDGGTFTMTSGEIGISGSGNTAINGGGLFVDGGNVVLNGTEIGYNTASSCGGGVYVNNSKMFKMTGGTIKSNIATGTYNYNGGGGVYNAGEFNMSAGSIEDNSAKDSSDLSPRGGGVYNAGSMVMTGTAVIGNSSATSDDCAKDLNKHSNYASENGGGVFNASGATFKMNSASAGIYYNYSDAQGGGLYNEAAPANVTISAGNIDKNGANKPATKNRGGN